MDVQRQVQGILGTRVMELRLMARLSREELATRAGVTRHAVQGIEQGRNTSLRIHTVIGLARALGVSLDFLAGDVAGLSSEAC